jgi:hypothetical protein
VAGEVLLDTPQLTVIRVAGPVPRAAPAGWVAAMGIAWVAYLAGLLVGATALARRGLRRARSGDAREMSG